MFDRQDSEYAFANKDMDLEEVVGGGGYASLFLAITCFLAITLKNINYVNWS